MPDWKDVPKTDAQDTNSHSSEENITSHGLAAIQGHMDTQEKSGDQNYKDASGRDLTMRTYPSGDNFYVRVYDREKTPQVPETAEYGDVGRANLHLEHDHEGNTRARLQDIETLPGYQESGTGSVMLNECEGLAKQNNAGEIYGIAPDDEKTRQWYSKRGYQFRNENGTEVYKEL